MNGSPKNNKAENLFNPLPDNKEDATNIPAAPTNPPQLAKDDDIETLMKLARCTRAEARVALYNNGHHVYDALRSLWKIVVDPDAPLSEALMTPTKSTKDASADEEAEFDDEEEEEDAF